MKIKTLLEEKHVLEYISDNLSDFMGKSITVNNAKFHHNTSYKLVPSVLEHGILSMQELNKNKITSYSDASLALMDDIDSHINGNSGISLAVYGLTDLYNDEDEYYPSSELVDFSIDSSINARRITNHYGNEFVAENIITSDKFKSVDIRLINYIKEITNSTKTLNRLKLEKLIIKYNYIILISTAMKKAKLNIPLREMSLDEGYGLNIDKIATSPTLILK
ncbi:MAG: hypothetical protein RSA10_03275 [Bacilli bacterium]